MQPLQYVCCSQTWFTPHQCLNRGEVRLPLFMYFAVTRSSIGVFNLVSSPLAALCTYHFPFISMLTGRLISSPFLVVSHFSRTHFPRRLNILSARASHFLLSLYSPLIYLFFFFVAHSPSLLPSFLSPLMLEAAAYS